MVDLLKLKHARKHLPECLTCYDLLKALAIILMIVDHIGYFFYPDETWWRIFGRLSVPIWFFLIGYSRTRGVPQIFWAAGTIVAVSALAAGEYLFPINIIFMLAIARLMKDWMFVRALRNSEAFLGMFFLLLILSPFSLVVVEYGTLGLMFTLFGVLRRRRIMVRAPQWMMWLFMFGIASVYILSQSFLLPTLTLAQFVVLVAGMIVVMAMLYHFRRTVYTNLTPQRFAAVALIQLMGRRTLEIYVLHIVALRAIVMITQPERFEAFAFDIFALAQLQQFILG